MKHKGPTASTIGSALRIALCGVFIQTSVATQALADEFTPFPPHQCPYIRCVDDRTVERNNEVQPIRLSGKTISFYDATPNKNIQRLYFASMKRFPDVESCLDSPYPASQLLIDARMRWREFDSQFAAIVCLFRLFDAMRNPALAAQWFSNNGFSDVRDLPGSQARTIGWFGRFHDAEDVRVVSAYWPTLRNGRLYGSALRALLERLVSLGITFNAVFDREGNVVLIKIGSNPRFPK